MNAFYPDPTEKRHPVSRRRDGDRLLPKLKLKGRTRRQSAEKGLTLMECLVAILMISAVMVAITPPIFLTVATRVQNRKAEQALQLANGEIDQVRVLVEQGITQDTLEQLPGEVTGGTAATSVAAPSSSAPGVESINDCGAAPAADNPDAAREVDVDGDCEPDFLVQSFITNARKVPLGGIDIPLIFEMGVRVYSMAAKPNLGGLEKDQASVQLTSGEGQQTIRPLAVIYTVLGKGDLAPSLEEYCYFKGGDASECSKQ
jgi:type II secretory pathway pseudopilin PulG